MPTSSNPAQRLWDQTTGTRVSTTTWGTTRALNREQTADIAEALGANSRSLRAAKCLIPSGSDLLSTVRSTLSSTRTYWHSISLPFPEPGVRLIRRDQLADFDARMTAFSSQLQEAVVGVNDQYSELKDGAREELGQLFDPADYPESLVGLFSVQWSIVNLDPPPYLRNLCPELYRQEMHRARAQFRNAIQLAERSYVEHLADLIAGLSRRLESSVNGTGRALRAVRNLYRFFERFEMFNVNSNEELDELVTACRRLADRVEATLDDFGDGRRRLSTAFGSLEAQLHGMLVERPRRRIIRPNQLP